MSEDFGTYWAATAHRLDAALANLEGDYFAGIPSPQLALVRRLLAGGKRLRGGLTCLVSEAFGGRAEDAVQRAVAIECIQAASLIHDDFVDGDRQRRDGPTLWLVAGPRVAVLLGDLIFSSALRHMVALSRDDGITAAEAIATMAHGAFREGMESDLPAMAARDPGAYNRIIHLKSGSLFAAAAKLGAIAAGAPPEAARQAYTLGARVGEAYQIADDLQDVLSVPEGRDTPRLAELEPVLLRFGDAGEASAPGRDHLRAWLERVRPSLVARMEHEVRQRLDEAASLLESLSLGRSGLLLQSALPRIVWAQRSPVA